MKKIITSALLIIGLSGAAFSGPPAPNIGNFHSHLAGPPAPNIGNLYSHLAGPPAPNIGDLR